ncbi:MAG TPA: sigma 54-interacting transcriptional regulator [Kofleriaceae bacterium]|nr:sigma 54-interacting transcriptional regulator [Kofleriaceae bacterium]
MTDLSEPTVDAADLTRALRGDGPARFFLALAGEPGVGSRLVDVVSGHEITFGRSRGATVSVDNDQVSRLHTRVKREGDVITVEDLGSRNGTRVNGVKISGVTELSPGDELAIGPITAVLGRSSRLRRDQRVADAEVFEERLAAELDRAVRYHRPVAVAMARVEGGDDMVDKVAAAMRRMDVVAEFGGDELALLMPERARDEAVRELSRIALDVAALSGTATFGVAVAPGDGTTVDQVISEARAALRGAKAGQVAASPPTPSEEASDALVIDPAMKRLYEMLHRIAATPMTVLVYGETGVGKELVAETVHRRSSRRDAPLVKLNCASLPENLLESELFGHERGAFTGAERRKLGFFEAATGGTLFLDEIGEMPSSLQAKLLRVLERKVVTRVGGTAEIPVDVRVIAATNRDLETEVRDGRFREDLYFRIAGFTVVVPPLRDRTEEIVPLAERFAARFAAELGRPAPTIAADARAALQSHDWPGNVRELKNAIDRALVLATGGEITATDLPDKVVDARRRAAGGAAAAAAATAAGAPSVRDQLADVERAAIVAALDACGGNQTHAAKQLGLSRRALIYKMERHGLKALPASAGTGGAKPGGTEKI